MGLKSQWAHLVFERKLLKGVGEIPRGLDPSDQENLEADQDYLPQCGESLWAPHS